MLLERRLVGHRQVERDDHRHADADGLVGQRRHRRVGLLVEGEVLGAERRLAGDLAGRPSRVADGRDDVRRAGLEPVGRGPAAAVRPRRRRRAAPAAEVTVDRVDACRPRPSTASSLVDRRRRWRPSRCWRPARTAATSRRSASRLGRLVRAHTGQCVIGLAGRQGERAPGQRHESPPSAGEDVGRTCWRLPVTSVRGRSTSVTGHPQSADSARRESRLRYELSARARRGSTRRSSRTAPARRATTPMMNSHQAPTRCRTRTRRASSAHHSGHQEYGGKKPSSPAPSAISPSLRSSGRGSMFLAWKPR